ncbi:MAG: nucleoside hydrolase [Actinomycetota bacterium]
MPPIPLILDTDIGTDVDDALALAFALRHPSIDLTTVTTVSGDTEMRARIAATLLEVAGRGDIEVAAGVGRSERPAMGLASMGHEGLGLPVVDVTISPRHAVEVLLDAGVRPGARPEIATVGMQTNIAAALERDGGLVGRVSRVAVMGGVFAPIEVLGAEVPPSSDHNLNVDPDASLRALNAGMPLLYVPLNVTAEVFLTRAHLERLRAGDELCRVLARLIDVWAPILQRIGRGGLPEDCVAVMHDPLTVACMVEEGFVSVQDLPVTAALVDGNVRTFVDPVAGRPARVVTSVDAPAFSDFWLGSVLA